MGGFLSLLFSKSLLALRERFLAMPSWSVWFQPVLGAALIGSLGYFVPQVLGVGYLHVGTALNGGMTARLMLLLLFCKIATVAIAYASGNAGGIFGPALFMGAMAGGFLGSIAHAWLPKYTATSGAYALVGMGTLFAGIIRAPMTSVIMIFEVTHDYAVVVPLMIANLASFYISRKIQPETLYELLALQEGIHLPAAKTQMTGGPLRVADAMRPPAEVFRWEDRVSQAVRIARASRSNSWLVLDGGGIAGIISKAELEQAVAGGSEDKPLGEILAARNSLLPHVHEDQPLEVALRRLGESGLDTIPVVHRANIKQLVGVITVSDILHRYGVRTPL